MESQNNQRNQQQCEDKSKQLPKVQLEKISKFEEALSRENIIMKEIQSLSFKGIPDESRGLRSIIWRILLNILPLEKSKWENSQKKYKETYETFIDEFLGFKQHNNNNNNNGNQQQQQMKLELADDHPLNTSQNSVWSTYFKDQELWDEIEKDTTRTRADMHFFQKETKKARKYATHSKTLKKQSEPERHNEVILRILFIYCKLNPGISYVQGMNELLAPIYYCFANEGIPEFSEYVESDSFFCFMNLMGEIKESFLRQCDSTIRGIKARINELNLLLKEVDYELWSHLEEHAVNPQYYSLRWLLLFLTQEFMMTEVLRMWDSLLAHPNKLSYLNYICLAILQSLRDDLLYMEFSDILPKLQKLNNVDIYKALSNATLLYIQYGTNPDNQFDF